MTQLFRKTPAVPNWNCEGVNCAGLTFNINDGLSLQEAKSLLSLKAKPWKEGYSPQERDEAIILQEFTYHAYYTDNAGKIQEAFSGDDFHIVRMIYGPRGTRVPNVSSTNGKRPIIHGKWIWQTLVHDGDRTTANNKYEQPAFWDPTEGLTMKEAFNIEGRGFPLFVNFDMNQSKYLLK